MTAGSDDCTICLPVDCEGQEEWHMTRVGLNGALTLLRVWEPNPQGRKVWFWSAKPGSARTMRGRDEGGRSNHIVMGEQHSLTKPPPLFHSRSSSRFQDDSRKEEEKEEKDSVLLMGQRQEVTEY